MNDLKRNTGGKMSDTELNDAGAGAAQREAWHLDKRVPVAFILALCVQTAGLVAWAATLQSNVEESQARIAALETRQAADDRALAELQATLARLDERTGAMQGSLSRLESRLEARR